MLTELGQKRLRKLSQIHEKNSGFNTLETAFSYAALWIADVGMPKGQSLAPEIADILFLPCVKGSIPVEVSPRKTAKANDKKLAGIVVEKLYRDGCFSTEIPGTIVPRPVNASLVDGYAQLQREQMQEALDSVKEIGPDRPFKSSGKKKFKWLDFWRWGNADEAAYGEVVTSLRRQEVPRSTANKYAKECRVTDVIVSKKKIQAVLTKAGLLK